MEKLSLLKGIIARYRRVCVSFSGGVDSSLLLMASREVLGDGAFAVFMDSALIPRNALRDALAVAREIGASSHVVKIDALNVEAVTENSLDRCFYCKERIFGEILKKAAELGADAVFDGTNADDAGFSRPGEKAARALGVISPLRDAGFSKEDVRRVARRAGLSVWDKPSDSCLATRIPYGVRVTGELLARVEAAEESLRARGFSQVRARIHGGILRIEVAKSEMEALTAARVAESLKRLGFDYVTLDLEGFRSGSMDIGGSDGH